MKTTKTDARKNLVINGALLDAVLKGSVIIDSQFDGWDWSILVKFSKPTNDNFSYGQFETNDGVFYLAVQRNGSTKKQVWNKYYEDYTETRRSKERAFELGNIT